MTVEHQDEEQFPQVLCWCSCSKQKSAIKQNSLKQNLLLHNPHSLISSLSWIHFLNTRIWVTVPKYSALKCRCNQFYIHSRPAICTISLAFSMAYFSDQRLLISLPINTKQAISQHTLATCNPKVSVIFIYTFQIIIIIIIIIHQTLF